MVHFEVTGDMQKQWRWGMIGLYGLLLDVAILLIFCSWSGNSRLEPREPSGLVLLTIMLAPFICGVPGIVSLCRRERPYWAAITCVVLGVLFGLFAMIALP